MEELFNKPPHDNTHTACGTPNPPWWCNEDQPAASIDAFIMAGLLIAMIYGMLTIKYK